MSASDATLNEVKAPEEKARAVRRAVLDLAPLELDCMNTLWPMGEATVRDIRDRLAPKLPRAYTTIMTIMDRLARKGVVERRKVNRAYVYRPNLSAEQARTQALGQVIANFFGGSKEALVAQLALVKAGETPRMLHDAARVDEVRVSGSEAGAVNLGKEGMTS